MLLSEGDFVLVKDGARCEDACGEVVARPAGSCVVVSVLRYEGLWYRLRPMWAEESQDDLWVAGGRCLLSLPRVA